MYDVTDRKQFEEELSKALSRERAVVERLQRLDEVKNTLLHAVSHDLRSPITSMLGSAVTLEREEDSMSAEDRRALVRGLASSARKMHRIVNDLLDMDRIERGIVEPRRHLTDVGALVRRVVEELGFTTDRPIEVMADDVVIAVDGPKIERIVENLLANTSRHTPAGTQVWVRVERSGNGAMIVVEDDGPGVPRELWDTIFEPFKRGGGTDAPGVGIGLSLVARFAELHGGRAWVDDRPGGGAAFHVFVPDGPAERTDLMELDRPPVLDR
jgi:K+-sensing histidine kinase KdpD